MFYLRKEPFGGYQMWWLGKGVAANVAFITLFSIFFSPLQFVIEPFLPALRALDHIFLSLPSEVRSVSNERGLLLQEAIPLMFIAGVLYFGLCWKYKFEEFLTLYLVLQTNPTQLESDEELEKRIKMMRSIRAVRINFWKEPVLKKITRQQKFRQSNSALVPLIFLVWACLYATPFDPSRWRKNIIFDPRHDLFLLFNAAFVILLFHMLFAWMVQLISVYVYKKRRRLRLGQIPTL